MDFNNASVKFSDIQQDIQLADLYTTIYAIPRGERVKVLMSWLANAYSDLLIPFLTESDVLGTFVVHVRLLNTFANNSPYEVVAQLASEFGDKFLKSQVVPNLLESFERTADATFHVQTLCEHLTCPSLIRKVMDVVTSDLTPILIGRMLSENTAVSTATLSLIKTLLEFYCEDLWYDLILQYLLPMKHLLTSQRQKMLPEIEFNESTHKLLETLPKHVTDTIKATLLADHFLLYLEVEGDRIKEIDNAVASSLPSSRSELQKVGLGMPKSSYGFESDLNSVEGTTARKPNKNTTYPMWIFQYDGTDFLHALRGGFIQEPEEFFEDDLFSVAGQLNASSTSNFENDSGLPLPPSDISFDEDNFGLDSLSVTTTDNSIDFNDSIQLNDTGSSPIDVNENFPKSSTPNKNSSLTASIVKDKRRSFDNLLEESDSTYNSYFGPFINALYEIIRNWTKVDPNVLFTTTEIISVLASSRIPLVNTLFLDMSLTLQPSFPSFPSLLHGIQQELDEKTKNYPDYIFRNVWRAAAKECAIPEVVSNRNKRDDDDDNEEDNLEDNEKSGSIVGSLKRAIGTNRSFQLAKEVSRRSASFRAFTDIFKNPTKTASPSNSDASSEFRLLNRAAHPFESDEEENTAKTMALRSVLFTHWMLELGAIALQLCWGRKSVRLEPEFPDIPEEEENKQEVAPCQERERNERENGETML